MAYRVIPEHDLIERRAVIENGGTKAIEVERIMSSAWTLTLRDNFHLPLSERKWGREFQVEETDTPQGK